MSVRTGRRKKEQKLQRSVSESKKVRAADYPKVAVLEESKFIKAKELVKLLLYRLPPGELDGKQSCARAWMGWRIAIVEIRHVEDKQRKDANAREEQETTRLRMLDAEHMPALFLFHRKHPFRKFCVKITNSKPFNATIMGAIIINSLMMGLVDFATVDSNGIPASEGTSVEQIFDPTAEMHFSWRNAMINSVMQSIHVEATFESTIVCCFIRSARCRC